jgi:hypothetical protein
MKLKALSKWFLTFTIIIMMANAAIDYKQDEYFGMSLALVSAVIGLIALFMESKEVNN